VADVGEAVLGGDRIGPAFDGRPGDFDRASAAAADQVVVVVPGAAAAVEGLPAGVRSASRAPSSLRVCTAR
jgi:hypothetical protein